MLLTNEWYYFTGAVDADTCQKLIDLGDDKFQDGHVDRQNKISEAERITGKKGDPGLDTGSRASDITWIHEQWVYELIFPASQLKSVMVKLGAPVLCSLF